MKRKSPYTRSSKKVLISAEPEIFHIPRFVLFPKILSNKLICRTYILDFQLPNNSQGSKALKISNSIEGVQEFMLDIVSNMHSYEAQSLNSKFLSLCKDSCIFKIQNSGIIRQRRSSPVYVFITQESQYEMNKYTFKCGNRVVTQAYTKDSLDIGIIVMNQNYSVSMVEIKPVYVMFVLRKAERFKRLTMGLCKAIMEYL